VDLHVLAALGHGLATTIFSEGKLEESSDIVCCCYCQDAKFLFCSIGLRGLAAVLLGTVGLVF
jgi:hypothetical protein